MAMASWIKVIVATVSYLLLIPALGIYGAAIALMISNSVECYWVYKQSTKIYDMELQLRSVFLAFGVTVVFVFFGFLLPEGGVIGFVLRVILVLLLMLVMYKMPLLTEVEKAMAASFFSGKVKLLKRKLIKL